MKAQVLALAAIVLAGFALRFAGLGRELPHRIEPDAFLAYKLQSLEGDPALVQAVIFADRYPPLIARTLALLPYPEVPANVSGPGDERAHLAAAAHPFLLVRAAVALCSALGVALTWFLARRFLSPPAALLAVLFAATSLLSLLFSGQARPHGIEATLALIAVLLAISVRRRARPGRILLATVAAALSVASLQNGLFALLPLGAGIVLGRRENAGGPRRSWIRAALPAALACLVAGAVALASYPGLPYVDAQGIHLGSEAGLTHSIRPSFANLGGIPALVRILWENDPVLASLSLAGVVLGLSRFRRSVGGPAREVRLDLLVVLAYALPYFGALALDPNVQERFLLPLIPALACLAAGALVWILAWIRGPFRGALRSSAGFIAGSALLVAPVWVAVRYARVAASADTLERAADWIRENVDPKECILTTPGTVLPLLIDAEALRADLEDPTEFSLPWLAYQRLLPAVLEGDPRWRIRLLPVARRFDPHGLDRQRAEEWIRETQADFVLLEDSVRMHRWYRADQLELAAAGMGDLAYRSNGLIPGRSDIGPMEYQGARNLARRLLSADAFGPGILIYRIRR